MISTLYESFRHWSEGGSIYILSDLHFDDFDCRLMDPTWITPREQIDIINKTVMKNDRGTKSRHYPSLSYKN